jgi:WD40 repeat protein/energy-coupling factor transporter ATP-binding protein EcfA2
MSTSEFKLNLAVVIGINDYQNGISTLGTARQDAEAIAKILETDYNYQVHLITDKTDIQATSKNLKDWLEKDLPEAIKVVNPSRLIFYFAGHGIALNGDDGPQGYLIPQDAKLGDVSTYLPMQQVEEALTKLSCRHCLVILDCCFAGAFRWSSTRKLVPITETIHKERYDRFIQDPAWQVITSAASDQYALDMDLKGDRGIAKNNTNHSPFAAALMSALSGSADAYPPASNGKPAGDGVITATELYLYLRDSVEIPADANNQRQTPQIWCLKKHDKGEFIFLPPGHELNLPSAPSLNELEDNNPYRGLKSYETKDSALFFGRTALIDKLCNAVGDRPFTVVLGASGSGKSSLVKAGLIAHLDGSVKTQQAQNKRLKPQEYPHQCKYQGWKILAPIRPGKSPLKSLKSVLKELGIAKNSQIDPQIFIEAIAVWSQTHPETKLLLVIDQFEELITFCRSDQKRQEFLVLLADLLKAHSNVLRLVVTLRSDFEPQLRSTPLEPLWQDARFMVPAMSREELRIVIEEPASAKVVYFESLDNRGYLVDQLIDEVAGMPGALPLLSFALSELYFKLVRHYLEAQNTSDTVERAITWDDYDAIGGVTKSLTRRADEEYNNLVKADPAYEKTIRHVMLRMVTVGGELARRQVPESELEYPGEENERVQKVRKKFVSARLLVSGTDVDNNPYLEPAHDSLVKGWERLLTWKKKEEENLILQRRLTPAATEWDSLKKKEKNQPKGSLDKAFSIVDWLDRRLFTIENLPNKIPTQFSKILRPSWNQQSQPREESRQFLWNANPYLGVLGELDSKDNWLNQVEAEFVQQSILQKRRNSSWWWRIALLIILILSGLTVVSLYQWRSSELNRANSLGRYSLSLLAGEKGLDVWLEAIKAGKILQKQNATDSVVTEALLRAISGVSERDRLEGHDGSVDSVSFSPDGKTLATGSADKTIKLWNLGTDKEIRTLQGHDDSVDSVSFSPDGKTLATGSADKTIKLWNLETGKEIRTLKGHNATVWSVSFSPDGKTLATGSVDKTIKLWNLETGKVHTLKKGHNDQVLSVSFSPDGKTLATGSADKTIKLWNLETGEEILTLKGHNDWVMCLSFSRDGKTLATGSDDKTIKLWNLEIGKEIHTFKGHDGSVDSVSFSPDGKTLATGSNDETVKLWNPETGKEIRTLKGHNGWVKSVSFSRDGKTLATGSNDKTIKLWNLEADKEIHTLKGHNEQVKSVSFSRDGKTLATGSNDKMIKLWNLETDKEIRTLKGHDDLVDSVSFSHDGKTLATGSDDTTIKLWNLETGKEIDTLKGHHNTVWSVSFSPDGKTLATGSADKTIKLWNLETDKEIRTLKGHDDSVDSIQFSRDGKTLATGSDDKTIKLWNPETGKEIRTLKGHKGWVICLSFSPDGKTLATGSADKTVKLWNPETGKEIRTLNGHNDWVMSVSFSIDGKILATGSADNTVKLWNVKTGKEIYTLKGHVGTVESVSFSPDGKTLATGSDDKTIKLWKLDFGNLGLDSLMGHGCDWVKTYLQNNPNITKSDRHMCDGISTQK